MRTSLGAIAEHIAPLANRLPSNSSVPWGAAVLIRATVWQALASGIL